MTERVWRRDTMVKLAKVLAEATQLPSGDAAVQATPEELAHLAALLKDSLVKADRRPGRPLTHKGYFVAVEYHRLHILTYQEGVTTARIIEMVLERRPDLRQESKDPEGYVDSAQRKFQEQALDAIWLSEFEITDEQIAAYRRHLLSHRHEAA
jgi:hypothetical protein